MFKLVARALTPPLALGVLCTAACIGPSPASGRPKRVVLGFDGMDPDLVVAPTVFEFFDRPIPGYIDGKPLF